MKFLTTFWQDERAQDVVEYALLLAFVVLCSAALFLSNREGVATIWTVTNNSLSSANSMAN
jgi:Flp pilus assembly pilin Flp